MADRFDEIASSICEDYVRVLASSDGDDLMRDIVAALRTVEADTIRRCAEVAYGPAWPEGDRVRNAILALLLPGSTPAATERSCATCRFGDDEDCRHPDEDSVCAAPRLPLWQPRDVAIDPDLAFLSGSGDEVGRAISKRGGVSRATCQRPHEAKP